MTEDDGLCQLCCRVVHKYVCPRCNVPYCSVDCYRSVAHSDCSEAFYKSNVEEMLRAEGPDSESRRRMVDMLRRVEEEDEGEISDDDDDDSLTDRLAEVDLDDAEDVWSRLLPEERQQFADIVRGGDVSHLVPEWEPWWTTKYPTPKVRFADEEGDEYRSKCPPTRMAAPLATLTRHEPAPQVLFNLMNVIAAYAFTARYSNGECDDAPLESAATLLAASRNLSDGQIFDDADTALESVRQAVVGCQWIVLEADSNRLATLRSDVSDVLSGPNAAARSHYARAALSHAASLLTAASKCAKKPRTRPGNFSSAFPQPAADAFPPPDKQLIAKSLRKVDYLLAWIDAHLHNYSDLLL